MEDMLYTVEEVADILKTSKGKVLALKDAGLLRFIKIGHLKCRKKTLEEFLEKYDGMNLDDPNDIKALLPTT